MPSRKRNKGKERKTKKAASNNASKNETGQQQEERQRRRQAEEEESRRQLECLIRNLSLNKCTHGASIVSEDDIWNDFMLEFDTALRSARPQTSMHHPDTITIFNSVADTISKNKTNLYLRSTQDDYMKTRLACTVRLGTDYILNGQNYGMAGMLVLFVVNIEAAINGEDIDYNCPRFISKIRDLLIDKKNLTKFFMKRAKCDCLKGLYKQVKPNTTIGVCSYCGVQKKRSDLLLCTGCRVAQYCSGDCQRSAWPEHQDSCAVYKTKLQSD